MSVDMMGSFHRLQLEGCDRCGHAASYEVKLASGGRLRFCAHHFHRPELADLYYYRVKDL